MLIGWPLNAPMVRFLVIIAHGCLDSLAALMVCK
jgi:hypothetical protein